MVVKTYLGVRQYGVVEGFQGGADVLYHGLGDAGHEAGLDGGDHGVDLPTRITSRRTGSGFILREMERDGGQAGEPHPCWYLHRVTSGVGPLYSGLGSNHSKVGTEGFANIFTIISATSHL